MQNARLNDLQAGIKISRRSNKKLRYIDNTTLKAENEEELKSLLIRVKRREKKAGLKLNIQKLRSLYLVSSLHGKEMENKWK